MGKLCNWIRNQFELWWRQKHLFILFPPSAVYVDGIAFGKIIAPSVYTALSEDFQVEFQTTEILPLSLLNLKVSYLGPTHFRNIGHINFYTDEQSNSTRVKVPCSLFTRAGPYTLHVEGNDINTTLATNDNHLLEHKLDVRWPSAKLSVTHEVIETYPTDSVNAVIEFIDFECPVDTLKFEEVPSFQLELTYCGMYNIVCDSRSVPSNSTFPIQLIYGMQRSRVIPLNCEYFGLAGNYVLHLKPLPPFDSSLAASAFIKVILRFLSEGNQFFHSIEWFYVLDFAFATCIDELPFFSPLCPFALGWLE